MSGEPTLIHTDASTLRTAAAVASTAETDVGKHALASWTGLGGDAYRERRTQLLDTLDGHDWDLRSVADILDTYADELALLLAEIEQARARVRAAWLTLATNPLNLAAITELLSAQRALSSAVFRKRQLAERMADNIYAQISANDPTVPGYTWPPKGWPVERLWSDTPLPADILDNATFDPEDARQGGIGDCYLISSLMTLMSTDEGDAFLRENIRYDADNQGYWVTLYVDGEPRPFFVDHAISGGATEQSAAGVVTLYEAAMREYLTYAELSDGGWPIDTYRVLTGCDAKETWTPSDGWDLGDLADDFQESGYMVASTSTIDSEASPEMTQVQRTTPYGTYYTETVELVGPHAYAVTAVTEGGVWLMNPHGAGNTSDGGGSFRVSVEDFNRLFQQVATGEVP